MRFVLLCLLLLSHPALAVSEQALFTPVLRALNAPPAALKPSPYTESIDTNLVALYARELAAAQDGVPRTVTRVERNRRIRETMVAANARVAKSLSRSSDGKHAQRTRAIADKVFRILSTNPVSRVEAVGRYDQSGEVGFCFGRAAMVHYLLLKNGIPPERIAKIFVVGRLRYFGLLWDFHMATMVAGEKGKWWVIDNLYEKVLPHDEWMKRTEGFDVLSKWPRLRYYVTDARKFQPEHGKYTLDLFLRPQLKPFFTDLFQSLRKSKFTSSF